MTTMNLQQSFLILCLFATILYCGIEFRLSFFPGKEKNTAETERANEHETREEFLSRRFRVNAERLDLVQKTCQKYGGIISRFIDLEGVNLIDPEHKIGYCEIAKTGSRTWIKHFATINGFVDTAMSPQLTQRVNSKFGIENLHLLSQRIQQFYTDWSILSFSFVRHPFDRLAAAFDDKVVSHHDPGYELFANAIGSNFSRFVDFVLTYAAYKKCNLLNCDIDRHWRPMHTRCGYCRINYSVIGKQETFADDIKYIVLSGRLEDVLPAKDFSIQRNSMASSSNRTKIYFDQLSYEQKQSLYDLYKIDFEMFGYSPDEI